MSKRGKTLNSQSRELVVKLYNYFGRESVNDGPLLPLKPPRERVAEALGIGKKTVTQILKEKYGPSGSEDNTLRTPKKRKRDKKIVSQNQASPDSEQSNQQSNGIQQNHQSLQQQDQQCQLQQQLQQQQQQTLQQALQQQQQQSMQQQELQQQAQQQALIAQTHKGRMPRARPCNKPRGRITAYAFFIQTCREEHKKKHPEENVVLATFSTKCAERWNTMTEDEKTRFHEMAEQDKRRFDLEMQSYVPPKDVKVRGRKRNQMKDPNAPKRSLSAFFLFCNDVRSKLKGENPEYTMGDIAKELGRRWAAADPETKSKYDSLSEQDKARYDREMTAYKKGPLALTKEPLNPDLELDEDAVEFESDDYK